MRARPRLRPLVLVLVCATATLLEAQRREEAPPEGGCEARFLSQRRQAPWYPANGYGPQTSCAEPRTIRVKDTVSIPVYWLALGASWQQADAQARMDEAVRWYAQYCITVPVYPIAVKPADLVRHRGTLAAADTGNGDDYAKGAGRVFGELWEHSMRKPAEHLVVLFVDDFQAVKYGARVDSVSGNFERWPLILVTHNDSSSAHIVTHELVHGLGKEIRDTRSIPFAGGDRDNTWTDGGCLHGAANPGWIPDMGHPSRRAAGGAFANAMSDLMDWATYREFDRKKNIR